MADAFNLGWKLAAVLRGQARPVLLDTYSEERRAKAQELIDFDRDMARLFSTKPKDAAEAAQFQHYFKMHGRYTAGVATRYDRSIITGTGAHQDLARGYPVGMRFHSAPVVRLADARPLQLGHVIKADGRWRLIVFAPSGDTGIAGGPVAQLCDSLMDDAAGLLRQVTPQEADIDSVIDLRVVFQSAHRAMRIEALHPLLLPRKGALGLIDYEKAFCPDPKATPDIFDLRGIDRARGALVVVRPDQYVAHVLPLQARQALQDAFADVLIPV
jgi:phenol 2-monooxygenase